MNISEICYPTVINNIIFVFEKRKVVCNKKYNYKGSFSFFLRFRVNLSISFLDFDDQNQMKKNTKFVQSPKVSLPLTEGSDYNVYRFFLDCFYSFFLCMKKGISKEKTSTKGTEQGDSICISPCLQVVIVQPELIVYFWFEHQIKTVNLKQNVHQVY
jgi:hypothetical protein